MRASSALGIVRQYASAYISPRRTTSYSDLRRNLAAILDSVNQDHEPVVITRDRGKPAAVLMSLEDYEAMAETGYLLRSSRNADRLLAATRALDAGDGQAHDLAE